MALQNSGQISINDVSVELGTTGKRQLAESTSRDLCDVASGQVKLSDFYGKSDITYISATGGTISTSGDYKTHTFTSSGSFVISVAGSGTGVTDVTVEVAGGGSGGTGVNNNDYYPISSSSGGSSSVAGSSSASGAGGESGICNAGQNGSSFSGGTISGGGGGGVGFHDIGCAAGGNGGTGAGGGNGGSRYIAVGHQRYGCGGNAASYASGSFTSSVTSKAITIGGGSGGTGQTDGGCSSYAGQRNSAGGNGGSGMVKLKYKYQN